MSTYIRALSFFILWYICLALFSVFVFAISYFSVMASERMFVLSVDPGVANMGVVAMTLPDAQTRHTLDALQIIETAVLSMEGGKELAVSFQQVAVPVFRRMLTSTTAQSCARVVFVCENQVMHFGRGSGFRMHSQYIYNNIVYGLLMASVAVLCPRATLVCYDPVHRKRVCERLAAPLTLAERDVILGRKRRRTTPAAAEASAAAAASAAGLGQAKRQKKLKKSRDQVYANNKDLSILVGRCMLDDKLRDSGALDAPHHIYDAALNGLEAVGFAFPACIEATTAPATAKKRTIMPVSLPWLAKKAKTCDDNNTTADPDDDVNQVDVEVLGHDSKS